MKIIFTVDTVEPDEEVRAKRMINSDDAFSLLWDIDSYCRGLLKYSDEQICEKHLEEIRSMIGESNLMELYQ